MTWLAGRAPRRLETLAARPTHARVPGEMQAEMALDEHTHREAPPGKARLHRRMSNARTAVDINRLAGDEVGLLD